MANYSFTLRNDLTELNNEKIGRFDAYFPDVDSKGGPVNKSEIPKYVRINNLVFKKKHNGGNHSIFIAPGSMDPIDKAKTSVISYLPASKKTFFIYKLRNDSSQKWMFIGLIMAIIGVIIDSSFAIGKIHTFISCPKNIMESLLSIAMILKIAGLLIAFFKGFWESK